MSQGPYDVVLLPGGMPGAQNLAEVRKCEINGVERDASLHNSTELILMVAQSFLFLILYGQGPREGALGGACMQAMRAHYCVPMYKNL